MAAHEALSALVTKLSSTANTDLAFENFVKGILISIQTSIAESMTVAQFILATRVLLTVANASKESCIIITKSMIPASIAFYGFKTSTKLQITSLDFIGDLYDLAVHWEILNDVEKQVNEIPQHCLTAVSQPAREFQIAGFKTLMKVKNVLQTDLVLPFVEVLVHNIQHSQDNDLLQISIETVNVIARKFPEMIMTMVVKGKCDLDNLTEDKVALEKRLNLLSNLASIDDFTMIIIEQMLKVITSNDMEAAKVVESLSSCMSVTSLYSDEKVTQIESDHGLIDSILTWLYKEIETRPHDGISHGFILISNTIGSLPAEKQVAILKKYTQDALDKCESNENYLSIIECLYISLHQSVYDDKFKDILTLSLKIALNSENELIRSKSCALIAHFLNKAEFGPNFELLYETFKGDLSACSRENEAICPKLILLYGWVTKALLMRGSDLFLFWLQKVRFMKCLARPLFS